MRAMWHEDRMHERTSAVMIKQEMEIALKQIIN
jgi:hypothetical protein